MSTAFSRAEIAEDEPLLFKVLTDAELEGRISKTLKKTVNASLETAVKELPQPPHLENSSSFPSRFAFLLRARLLAMPFSFAIPLFFIFAGLIWTTATLPFPNLRISGAPVWIWGSCFTATIANFFLFIWLASYSVAIISARNYRLVKLDYYARHIAVPLGLVVACLAELGILAMLHNVDPIVFSRLYEIFGTILVFAIAAALTQICTRFSLARIDQNFFWYRMGILLWKRRTIRRLLSALRISAYENFYSQSIDTIGVEFRGNDSFIRRALQSDNAAYINNQDLLNFGEDDPFTHFLTRGVFFAASSGQSVDALLIHGSEIARYDQNLARVAVRIALLLFRRLELDLDAEVTKERLNRLDFHQKDSVKEISRILSKKNAPATFQNVVDALLETLREQQALDDVLQGTGQGGSVVRVRKKKRELANF